MLNWNVMIRGRWARCKVQNGAEGQAAAMKLVASGPRKLVKARKMTKDGRNKHTSDYLSVY